MNGRANGSVARNSVQQQQPPPKPRSPRSSSWKSRLSRSLPILYMDDNYCVIDKPRYMSVHPPEDEEGRKWTTKEQNAMWVLKKQLGGRFVQPVHRLDRATSGVVVYALNRESSCWLSELMKGRNVHKEYFAFVRGYTDTIGVIDKPLDGCEAVSLYETIARVQVPMEVQGSPFPTQRYSLVKVMPVTGRTHQIRRHFNRIAHPIIGDGEHGERFHNRKFARDLQLPGLFLRAASISFPTQSGDILTVTSPTRDWGPRWHALFDAMGVYPLIPGAASLLPRIPVQSELREWLPTTPRARRKVSVLDAPADQPMDPDRAAILQFKQLVSAMNDQKADAGVDLVSARQREKGAGLEHEERVEANGNNGSRGVDHLREALLSEFWSRLPSEPLPLLGQVPCLGEAGDQAVQF